MDGSPVSYPGSRLLEWWSSGRASAPARRSGRVSYRRDPSDGQVSSVVDFRSVCPYRCRNFYSECRRSFVPGNLTALMAYHAVVPFHHARRHCDEACVYR
ncbi:hypothetical protein BHE74_00059582 [Ensete ventricosum]|nr:hypothetical protein BHE74_00059582 [Ensete ventricosum]